MDDPTAGEAASITFQKAQRYSVQQRERKQRHVKHHNRGSPMAKISAFSPCWKTNITHTAGLIYRLVTLTGHALVSLWMDTSTPHNPICHSFADQVMVEFTGSPSSQEINGTFDVVPCDSVFSDASTSTLGVGNSCQFVSDSRIKVHNIAGYGSRF